MKRILLATVLGVGVVLAFSGSARADHYHRGGYGYGHAPGHYHYIPPHSHWHGDHIDYYPGTYQYHPGTNYYTPRSGFNLNLYGPNAGFGFSTYSAPTYGYGGYGNGWRYRR